jgi:hypothetical protein
LKALEDFDAGIGARSIWLLVLLCIGGAEDSIYAVVTVIIEVTVRL